MQHKLVLHILRLSSDGGAVPLLHITFCLLMCALNPSGGEIFGLDIGLASLGSRALPNNPVHNFCVGKASANSGDLRIGIKLS